MGGGGGGTARNFFVMGRGGSICSPNPDPISDQSMNNSPTPFLDISILKSINFKVFRPT